jgi:hypothetical protein
MAKSLRSKTKLAARRRKANMSHYAVADAERTARISARIVAKAGVKEDAEGDAEMEGDEEMTEGECGRALRGGRTGMLDGRARLGACRAEYRPARPAADLRGEHS